MAEPQNPFEDPEFLAELQRLGVQHKPGLAADLMTELAPLLKADGVDFDDPNFDLSEDEIQAAMDRAIEQHNLALFTPIGRDRANALYFLQMFVETIAIDGPGEAFEMLSLIEPEPQFDTPAGSQMIGVCLGLIDTWLAGEKSQEVLPVIPVVKWPGKARNIARDLLVLARHGRAFDQSDGFIRQHGGELVMQGAALAAAAIVLAVSRRDDVPVNQALEGLHFASEADGSVPVAYHAVDSSSAEMRAEAEKIMLGYTAWIERGLSQASEPDMLLHDLFTLEERALARGLSIHTAGGMSEMIRVLDRAGDGIGQRISFTMLEDYVQFRLLDIEMNAEPLFGSSAHNAGTAAEWQNLGETLDERLSQLETSEADDLPGQELLSTIVNEPIEPEQLQAALQRSIIAQGANELVEWLAEPRQVTSTGVVRRADIAHVAQMVGLRAVGSAKTPEPGTYDWRDPDRVHQVQSMRELPRLVEWWDALLRAKVIEVSATRVRRGPKASASGVLSAAAQFEVCSYFVEEFVIDRAEDDTAPFFVGLSFMVGQMIIGCLTEGIDAARFDADEAGSLQRDEGLPDEIQMLDLIGRKRVLELEQLGLLERAADQRLRVIPGVRSAIAAGIDAAFERIKRIEEI